MFKCLLLAGGAIFGLAASPAAAAPLLVSYAPLPGTDSAFSFEIDSNPVVTAASVGAFTAPATNGTGAAATIVSARFYSAGGGGFNLFGSGDFLFGYLGPQLFSGSGTAPTILTGTFALTSADIGRVGSGVLTISSATAAVPEPATWGLMLAGFGMVGAGLRSRRRSVTFAKI